MRVPLAERLAARAEGEYYQADLIGCEVVRARARASRLGVVTGWQEAGGAGLLEVGEGDGKLLIPFARAICVEIDACAKRIRGGVAGRVEGFEPTVTFHVLTIFPEFFRGPFEHGVVARAREAGRVEIRIHNLAGLDARPA